MTDMEAKWYDGCGFSNTTVGVVVVLQTARGVTKSREVFKKGNARLTSLY
jgi:hypothetical protein